MPIIEHPIRNRGERTLQSHRATWRNASILRVGAALACMLILVNGCTDAPRAAAVDSSKAREALQTTLEGWKNGKKPEDLKTGPMAITAQDLDWLAGYSLVSYQVVDEGKNDDANLRIPVELKLRDPAGKEVSKRVSYVVGTNPSVTVFREL